MERKETIRELLERELLSWKGVSVHPHRFGGIEFQYLGKELGHLHGDSMADMPFPKQRRDELVADGRVQPHHMYPESGWVTFYIRGAEEVPRVLELFQMQYERIRNKTK